MNRKTLIALAAFAVLGILAVIALTPPEKGERRRRPARGRSPSSTPPTIETIEVTKGGATTVIKSEGGKYKVIAPVAYAADEAVAKAAFEALGKMDVSDLVTDRRPSRPSSRSTTRAASTWSPRRQGRQGAGRLHRRQGDRRGDDGPARRQGRGLAGQRHLQRTCSTSRPPTGATRASRPSRRATPSRSRSRPRTAARRRSRRPAPRPATDDKWDGRRVIGEDRQARQLGPERHRVRAVDLEGERLRGRREAGRRRAGAAGADGDRRPQGRQEGRPR